jgi:hypothetical protein
MRSKLMMLAFALFLSAPGAFAAEKVTVNIPFSFESHGKHFPASQYEVELSTDRSHLTLSSKQSSSPLSLSVLVESFETDQTLPKLSVRFVNVNGIHTLQSIRLGSYGSAVLTARSKVSSKRQMSSAAGN